MYERILNLSKSNIRISKTVPIKGSKMQSNASQQTKQHHSPNYIRLHSPASLTSGLRIPPAVTHWPGTSCSRASIPLSRFHCLDSTALIPNLCFNSAL